jgi:hypothetical protein
MRLLSHNGETLIPRYAEAYTLSSTPLLYLSCPKQYFRYS